MPKLPEALECCLRFPGTFLSGGARRVGAFFKDPLDRASPLRRLPALAGLCVLLALILVLLLQALPRERPPGGAGVPLAQEIPPEEFFLPREPDFSPGLLFEREKRAAWTGEDAGPYWTDPLDYGPDFWVRGVRGAVDELLERVP
jgi:hypothetical protein